MQRRRRCGGSPASHRRWCIYKAFFEMLRKAIHKCPVRVWDSTALRLLMALRFHGFEAKGFGIKVLGFGVKGSGSVP